MLTDLNADSPISSVSTFEIATADPTDDLATLAKAMHTNGIGALLIKGHDDALAIVTERDIVRALAEDGDAWAVDCMTRDVIVVDATMSIADAVETMLVAGVRHLVVETRDGRVGIASIRDLVGPLLDTFG